MIPKKALIGRYALWISTRGITTAKIAILARLLDSQTLGQWFAMLAAMVVPAGLAKISGREFLLRLDAEQQDSHFSSAFLAEFLAGVFASCVSILVWIPLLVASSSAPAPALVLASLFYLNFSSFMVFPASRREGRGQLYAPQIPLLVSESIGTLASCALLLTTDLRIGALVIGGALGTICGFLSAAALALPIPRFWRRIVDFRAALVFGAPAAINSFVTALASSLLLLALARFHGNGSVAAYGLIVSLAGIVSAPLSVLEHSFYPSFAASKGDSKILIRLLLDSSWIFSLVGGVVGAIMIFNSHLIVEIYAGSRWSGIEGLIQILGAQLVVRFSTIYLYGHVTYATSRTRQMLTWAILDLALAATLGVWMIHAGGTRGAVIYQLLHAILLIPLVRIPALKSAIAYPGRLLPALVPVAIWLMLLLLVGISPLTGVYATIIFLLIYMTSMLLLPRSIGRPNLKL